jgi:hypothetical protein
MVAPRAFSPTRRILRASVSVFALSINACGASQILTPSERAQLQVAREQWMSRGIHSYRIEFQRECLCQRSGEWVRLTVQQDSVVGAVVLSTNEQLVTGPQEPWLHVNEFFERIERLVADPGNLISIRVAFDATLGYPTFVSFVSEAVSEYARQDNFLYRLRNLTPVSE